MTAHQFPANVHDVWFNHGTPVIFRPDGKGNLMLRMPYREGNRAFLKGEKLRRFEPVWDKEKKFWSVPKSWFTDLIGAIVTEFGSAYVLQPHHAEERCCAACQNARGLECTCQCMGKNHGKQGGASHWNSMHMDNAVVMPHRDGQLTVQFFEKV